jgi:predicted amidohydrolase
MFTVPVMDERFLTSAERLDGPFVTELGALAAQHGTAIVCGINEATEEGDRIQNTLLAIDASGDVVATYRKLHLYDAFGYTESSLVRPGEIEPPQTFSVGGQRFDMQTCYDLRFPEVTRRLIDAEVDVVLMPAEWVPGPLKEDHWTTLLRARAIENTVYLAAADQSGKAGAGNSMIVDPMGVVLASVGEEEGLGTATLDAERIARVRRRTRRFGCGAQCRGVDGVGDGARLRLAAAESMRFENDPVPGANGALGDDLEVGPGARQDPHVECGDPVLGCRCA